ESPAPEPVFGETDPSSFEWLTDELLEQYKALDCTDPANISGVDTGDPKSGHVACSIDGTAKLAMGPVELTGAEVSTASSGPEYTSAGTLTGAYQVLLEFNSKGAKAFSDVTDRLFDFYKENPDDDRAKFAVI